jgi:uncharacterized protein
MMLLAAVAFFVGLLIGMVGIGGILLIPAIKALTTLTTHESMATALFSFIFTAVVGTYMFARRGSIDWRVTIPVCLGALLFGYAGAMVNSLVNAQWLNMALAAIIVFSGAWVLIPFRGQRFVFDRNSRSHLVLMGVVGAAVGFVSGLTGVGGPVLSIPVMVVMGVAPLTAIAAGQVIQVAAAGSGTIGNLVHGVIDFSMAAWLSVVQLAGLVIGVRLAHRCQSHQLRTMVAVVCLVVGGFLFIRSGLALFSPGS